MIMRKTFAYPLFMAAFWLFQLSYLYSQTLVNQAWAHRTGVLDTVSAFASVTDSYGNLIIAGNTMNTSGGTDILLTKYNRSGVMLWQELYDSPFHQRDYAVGIACDAQDYIYVTGVVNDTTAQCHIVVLKYDHSGLLEWDYLWADASSTWNIPAGIAPDSDGDVYVGGTTYSPSTMGDYALIKLKSDGTLLWTQTYDYAGLEEVLTGIKTDAGGNVIVTGVSASGVQDFDYTTIIYNGADGSLLDAHRLSVPGVNMDKVLAMERDNAGNIYLTGYADTNGNRNIRTVRLDSTLVPVWVQDWDGEGLGDAGTGIHPDNLGNIYLTGYSDKSNGGRDLVTLKYDTAGVLLWENRFLADDDTRKAEGKKLAVLPGGAGVLVLGTVENGISSDMYTLMYDAGGRLLWGREYNGYNLGEYAADIQYSPQGYLYVVSRSQSPGGNAEYATVFYQTFEPNEDMVLDASGIPLYSRHQIIVSFSPDIVNTDFVDDGASVFALITEVLPDTVVSEIVTALQSDEKTVGAIRVSKLFRRLTTADSLSVTRLGDTIAIPKFWSCLVLHLPQNLTALNTQAALSSLTNFVKYADLVPHAEIFTFPNDPLYAPFQKGTGNGPEGINMMPAWEVNKGDPSIKIGVCDSRIRWNHDEFAGKVTGFDYTTHLNVLNQPAISPNFEGHGNYCASIIGSRSNNGKGGAGIAGGDAQLGNDGCSLSSLVTWKESQDKLDFGAIIEAIIESAVNSTNLSSPLHYGLHVVNHSWGTSTYTDILKDAVYTAYRNGVVNVCSSGNFPTTPCPSASCILYPQAFDDKWLIKVGASNNTNGRAAPFSANTDDIIAPGMGHPLYIFNSLDPLTTNGYIYGPNNLNLGSGTSFAAPHVSGVAGLMLSEHSTSNGYPNPLTLEDVERLMEKYATPVPLTPPLNIQVGYGRLDAGSGMQHLHLPDYQVYHATIPDNVATNVTTLYNVQVAGTSPSLTFTAELYEYEMEYNVNIAPPHEIIDAWTIPSVWQGGVSATQPVSDSYEPYMDFTQWDITANSAAVRAKTYQWHILSTTGGTIIDKWIPDASFSPRASFSLHIKNTATSANTESLAGQSLTAYPNPADTDVHVRIPEINTAETVYLHMCDLTGREVYAATATASSVIKLDISTYPRGIYLLRVSASDKSYTTKLIKL